MNGPDPLRDTTVYHRAAQSESLAFACQLPVSKP